MAVMEEENGRVLSAMRTRICNMVNNARRRILFRPCMLNHAFRILHPAIWRTSRAPWTVSKIPKARPIIPTFASSFYRDIPICINLRRPCMPRIPLMTNLDILCRLAPMPMICPARLLASLTAVLRLPASSALCKLSGKLFPLSTFPVSTLPDVASRFVLSAEVSHHNACPVVHISVIVPDCVFFNKREDVVVGWSAVFVVVVLFIIHHLFAWCLETTVH